jgi:peptide/nickel transport system permease protein
VLASVILSMLIAVPMAAIAARNRGRIADHAVRMISTFGIGFPPFWLGADADHPFQRQARYLPGLGLRRHLFDKLSHLILPSLTIALSLSAVLTRSLRAAMIEELKSDVATAARARGMPESIVFWRHVCRTRWCRPSICSRSTSAG